MRDVPAVVLTGLRLLVHHWPALLALSFLGSALRAGALWGAVAVSDVNGPLGQAMLVITPLGYLLPIVAMLAICRGSLPSLQAAEALEETAPTEGRPLRLVDVAVSVLVPFLAVYQAYGLLEQDIFRFRNAAAFDEYVESFDLSADAVAPDFNGRLGIYPLQLALMILLVATVLRFAIGRVERKLQFFALAFVGALVEVYYTAQLAAQTITLKTYGLPWLLDRRAVDWSQDFYDSLVDALGPVADAVRWADGAVGLVLGSFEEVVVVPVAWLAFGAVVLGYKLVETATETPGTGTPSFLRRLWNDVKERWSSLIGGLRLLTAAGLLPMLFFSLVFLVVIRIPPLLFEAVRLVVGPQPFGTTIAFEPMVQAGAFALSMAVTAPLLAAAIDWLVRTRTARRSQEGSTTPAPA